MRREYGYSRNHYNTYSSLLILFLELWYGSGLSGLLMQSWIAWKENTSGASAFSGRLILRCPKTLLNFIPAICALWNLLVSMDLQLHLLKSFNLCSCQIAHNTVGFIIGFDRSARYYFIFNVWQPEKRLLPRSLYCSLNFFRFR